MKRRPGLMELGRLMWKHAAFTVGGGGVTMIALERDIVEREGWMGPERFRALYGVAKLTPGTSILALAAMIGWEFGRWRGALAMLAVASLPGCLLAAGLTAAYQSFVEEPAVRSFVAGAAAAVCGLIAATIWGMVEPYWRGEQRVTSCVVFLAALGMALWGWSPLPVLVGFGVGGYWRGK